MNRYVLHYLMLYMFNLSMIIISELKNNDFLFYSNILFAFLSFFLALGNYKEE